MLLLDFQLRMLRFAGEMMGAAAATWAAALTPSPASDLPPIEPTRPAPPARAEADVPAEGSSPLLLFPRMSSGVSRALADVQPAPRHEAPVPIAAFFPFAAFPMMGATPAWLAQGGPQAMTWPGMAALPLFAWTPPTLSPWTGLMAWTRMAPPSLWLAGSGLSPFLMSAWAMPMLRAWTDLAASATPPQSASAYRSASGYAVAQVVTRSLLLAAGTLTAMAWAIDAGAFA